MSEVSTLRLQWNYIDFNCAYTMKQKKSDLTQGGQNIGLGPVWAEMQKAWAEMPRTWSEKGKPSEPVADWRLTDLRGKSYPSRLETRSVFFGRRGMYVYNIVHALILRGEKVAEFILATV